jgi:hypothetical protein
VLFLTFDLPIMALATVTATAIEAIGSALAIWLAVVAALIVGSIIRGAFRHFPGRAFNGWCRHIGLYWCCPPLPY